MSQKSAAGVQGSAGSDADTAARQDPFAASLAPPASSAAGAGGLARTVTPRSPDDPFAPPARSAEAAPSGSVRQPHQQQQHRAAMPALASGPPKKSAEDILKMFDTPQVRR